MNHGRINAWLKEIWTGTSSSEIDARLQHLNDTDPSATLNVFRDGSFKQLGVGTPVCQLRGCEDLGRMIREFGTGTYFWTVSHRCQKLLSVGRFVIRPEAPELSHHTGANGGSFW